MNHCPQVLVDGSYSLMSRDVLHIAIFFKNLCDVRCARWPDRLYFFVDFFSGGGQAFDSESQLFGSCFCKPVRVLKILV